MCVYVYICQVLSQALSIHEENRHDPPFMMFTISEVTDVKHINNRVREGDLEFYEKE